MFESGVRPTPGVMFCLVALKPDAPNLLFRVLYGMSQPKDYWSCFRQGKSVTHGICLSCFTHVRVSALAEPKSESTVFFLTCKLCAPRLVYPRKLSFVITGLVTRTLVLDSVGFAGGSRKG